MKYSKFDRIPRRQLYLEVLPPIRNQFHILLSEWNPDYHFRMESGLPFPDGIRITISGWNPDYHFRVESGLPFPDRIRILLYRQNPDDTLRTKSKINYPDATPDSNTATLNA